MIVKNARNLCSMIEKKTGMRKRCLMKSVCCVFIVYFVAIVILSILYLSGSKDEGLFTHQAISSTVSDKTSNMFHPQDNWRHVSDVIYVYSAFWEYRTNPKMVRIIGIGIRLQNYTSQLICLMKYTNMTIAVTTSNSKNLEDNHDMMLSVKYFTCNAGTKPDQVALVSVGSKYISWLDVHDTKPGKNVSKNSIALCTQPLYKNNDKEVTPSTFSIAEFIAFYEILGVSQFYFYDHKADRKVKEFLNHLIQKGLPIKVMPWTFPRDIWYIWNYGQIASIADCIYKHASTHEYVAVVDLDEYIVPNSDITLQKLLQDAVKTNGSNWSSFMFRHTFFCLDYPDDPMTDNITLPFITQTKTGRGKIWDQYARAKSIVRPSAVVMPGIHYTWETFPGFNASLDITSSIALLHHYRRYLCRYEKGDRVKDRTAWRYRNRLLNSKAVRVWRNM